jgi:hypothetical protein
MMKEPGDWISMLVCKMGMMIQVTKRVIWSPMMDPIPATVEAMVVIVVAMS